MTKRQKELAEENGLTLISELVNNVRHDGIRGYATQKSAKDYDDIVTELGRRLGLDVTSEQFRNFVEM